MRNELLKYLEDFMSQNDWVDEYTPKQARAVFTTICLIGHINADTGTCDNMLSELYDKADIEISYDDFENYMLELIV